VQEIAVTKGAALLHLPVFVITTSANSGLREVHLGWVTGWDDTASVFSVAFSEEPQGLLPSAETLEEEPFRLTAPTAVVTSTATVRPGQARFKFEVFRRYGPICAVCDLDIDGLLDAAHIRDKRFKGVG
jgi:hypothetical protein